jgi:hypothetical protein
MSERIGKIVPTAIVAAVLAYLCWPYVNESTGAAEEKKENKLPVISQALLSPPAEPAPERDPFRQRGDKKWSAALTGQGTKKAAAPRALADVNPLGSQVLGATYIRGDRRFALISGHIYAEGEQLKGQSSLVSPLTVARIFPDKVLLRRDGETLELKYAAAPPRSADSAAPPKGGSPTGKAPEAATNPKPEKSG